MPESLPESICFSHCHTLKQFVTNSCAAEIPRKHLAGSLYPSENAPHPIFNKQPETQVMQKNHIIALGMAAAMLAGSCIAQAEDSGTRTELDQRNRIWSMQGVTDGTYTGDAERHQVQTQTQEQVRTRSYTGTGSGSRYGQGYESRQASGGFGSGPGGGGGRH